MGVYGGLLVTAPVRTGAVKASIGSMGVLWVVFCVNRYAVPALLLFRHFANRSIRINR